MTRPGETTFTFDTRLLDVVHAELNRMLHSGAITKELGDRLAKVAVGLIIVQSMRVSGDGEVTASAGPLRLQPT